MVVFHFSWAILSIVAMSLSNTGSDTRPNQYVLLAMGLTPFVLINSSKVKVIQRHMQMILSFVLIPIINGLITSRACLHGVDTPGTTELMVAVIVFCSLFMLMLVFTWMFDPTEMDKATEGARGVDAVEDANEDFSRSLTQALQYLIGGGVFVVFISSIVCWTQTTPIHKVVSGAVSFAFFMAISRYLMFLRTEKTGWTGAGFLIVDMVSSITSMALLVLLSRSTSTEMSMGLISDSSIAAFTFSLVGCIVMGIDSQLK